MKPASLLSIGAMFSSLSLVAVGGGNVLLPSMRRGAVDHQGWLDQQTFSHLFAISQAAPGPNVMLASAIGWEVRGTAGLVVATIAILLPSSIGALLAGRLLRRSGDQPWLGRTIDALVPLALGLMLASGVTAARTAGGGAAGLVISAAAAAAILFARINPLIVMAIGTTLFIAARDIAPWVTMA
jgi:chromate transporter